MFVPMIIASVIRVLPALLLKMWKLAVKATAGQVLMSESKICDARFSKCCGGAVEEFQYCWEDVKHPYLVKLRDDKSDALLPDLTQEAEAEEWIRTSPDAFCNTTDKKILSQVLNNYDQETINFYRWKVSYTQKELSELILKRSGVDYGEIIDLIPVERGTSGRLVKLKNCWNQPNTDYWQGTGNPENAFHVSSV